MLKIEHRDVMFQNPGETAGGSETFSFSESEVESVLLEWDFNRRSAWGGRSKQGETEAVHMNASSSRELRV